MNTTQWCLGLGAAALVLGLGSCSTWNDLTRSDKGTGVGAAGGTAVVATPSESAAATGESGMMSSQPGTGTATTAAAIPRPSGPAVPADESDTSRAPRTISASSYSANQPAAAPSNPSSAMTAANSTATPTTAPAMGAEKMASGAGASGHSAAVVRAAQRALNKQGYAAGKADGIWGPHTEQAVTKFQQAKGLTRTASLDDKTLAALGVSEKGTKSATSTHRGERSTATRTAKASQ